MIPITHPFRKIREKDGALGPIWEEENWEQCFLAAHALGRYIIHDVGPWCDGSTLTCPVKRCGFESRRVHSVLIHKERHGG